MGFPGSGKTQYSEDLQSQGYIRMSRDDFDLPGRICSSVDFHGHLDHLMTTGSNIVVDNIYPTVESRKLAIDLAKKYNYEIECWHLNTSIEDTEYNVCTRMIKRYGKLVDKNESDKTKADSNIFSPAVLFAYQNQIEIWAKDKYDEMLDNEPDEFGSIAESIFGGIKPLGNLHDPM